MAQSSSARSDSRHQRESARDRDDDHHRERDSRERDDDRSSREHDRHDGRDWGDDRHDGRHPYDMSNHRHDVDRGRHETEVDLDERRHGIDLDIDMDRHGRWLDIDVELGSLDVELEVDLRLLQPDETPMTAVVGGEGNAVGEDTLVDAVILSRLADRGAVTIAFGSASFESIAVSEDDLVFASAITFAEISGADLVFTFTRSTSTSCSEDGSSFASEQSTTRYVAIDFEEFDFLGGPLVLNYDDAGRYLGHGSCRCNDGDIQIDGNVAQLDADASAEDENTLVDVSASLLTVEDQLSSVSAVVVTAVA
jgi:hypothetical protein